MNHKEHQEHEGKLVGCAVRTKKVRCGEKARSFQTYIGAHSAPYMFRPCFVMCSKKKFNSRRIYER